MRLYEIASAFRAWSERVEEADGEIDDALAFALDAIEAELEVKADAICALVREADADAKVFREEAAGFTTKARAAENRAARLKDYLRQTLKALGRQKVEGKRFTATRVTAGVPSIRWVKPGLYPIPEEFRRVTVELDGTAAQAAYRDGVLPDGFEVQFSEGLRIK